MSSGYIDDEQLREIHKKQRKDALLAWERNKIAQQKEKVKKQRHEAQKKKELEEQRRQESLEKVQAWNANQKKSTRGNNKDHNNNSSKKEEVPRPPWKDFNHKEDSDNDVPLWSDIIHILNIDKKKLVRSKNVIAGNKIRIADKLAAIEANKNSQTMKDTDIKTTTSTNNNNNNSVKGFFWRGRRHSHPLEEVNHYVLDDIYKRIAMEEMEEEQKKYDEYIETQQQNNTKNNDDNDDKLRLDIGIGNTSSDASDIEYIYNNKHEYDYKEDKEEDKEEDDDHYEEKKHHSMHPFHHRKKNTSVKKSNKKIIKRKKKKKKRKKKNINNNNNHSKKTSTKTKNKKRSKSAKSSNDKNNDIIMIDPRLLEITQQHNHQNNHQNHHQNNHQNKKTEITARTQRRADRETKRRGFSIISIDTQQKQQQQEDDDDDDKCIKKNNAIKGDGFTIHEVTAKSIVENRRSNENHNNTLNVSLLSQKKLAHQTKKRGFSIIALKNINVNKYNNNYNDDDDDLQEIEELEDINYSDDNEQDNDNNNEDDDEILTEDQLVNNLRNRKLTMNPYSPIKNSIRKERLKYEYIDRC